ncbi:hypothetical protein FPV67DRAFT_1697873 [Lyophyllum atratum]|nr:hypothetical protein FPV67DRAFT_1697873 [Lyophyllum atratum]
MFFSNLFAVRSRTTRSSKGRLLTSTDPAASTALLTTQLRALGLYPADTIGDGNCLFRALSDQLYGSPSRHMELRGQICDWIEKHRERYEPFVEDERGLETHLQCMREHATYGGHMELSAFAHLTKRNVKVIQPGLVYVIEWAAFASPASSPVKTSSSHATYDAYDYDDDDDDESEEDNGTGDEDDAHLDDRDRRRLRRNLVRGVKEKKGKITKGTKDKGTHKRAPSPPPTELKHNEDGEGDTIYVAYHDWEHFSSIRNLRGPHTGLPSVRETPPPPGAALVSAASPTRAKKAPLAEKERKRKVTLKLSPSGTSTPTGATESAVLDPAGIPLPTSRAASPFPAPIITPEGPAPAPHPLRTSHVPSSQGPVPITSLPPHLEPPLPPSSSALPHLHPRTKQSPKRALDTTGDDSECSAASSSSKRSRTTRSRSRPSSSYAQAPHTPGMMDVERDSMTDGTPSLSPPSSAASSSSAASTPSSSLAPPSPPSSSASSLSPASSPEPEIEQPDNHVLPVIHSPARDRPMTRRQRKALGLPKPRAALGVGVGAGRIVIPGGRFRRGVGVGGGVGEEGGEGGEGEGGEWVRNGTGRVDVRGFRELKI